MDLESKLHKAGDALQHFAHDFEAHLTEAFSKDLGEMLLKHTRKGDLKNVLALLFRGADPNFQNTKTGDFPLLVAAEKGYRHIVRALIVFDADLTLKNHSQQTALDVAEINGIEIDISEIVELRKNLDKDQEKQVCGAVHHDSPTLLLSLDGGGIRGLVFIQVLLEMEKRRQKLYPHSDHLLSHFNWLTGNSTGGIAALAFAAKPKMTLLQGREMYFELKNKVITGDPPFSNEKVDKVFQKTYGLTTKMSDIDAKVRKVSIMTTLAREAPPVLHIMSNYGPARNKELPPSEQLVWKAARATSSVPIFFHPQDEVYLDGGLIANNPTADAIIDMFEYDKNVNLKLVLSLGCGLDRKPESIDDVDCKPFPIGNVIADVVGKHGHLHSELQEFLLVARNVKPFKQLLDVVGGQITQPNGAVLTRAKFIAEKAGASYYRINPEIDHINFLETDDGMLIDMLYQVICYMLKNCATVIDPVLECIYGQ